MPIREISLDDLGLIFISVRSNLPNLTHLRILPAPAVRQPSVTPIKQQAQTRARLMYEQQNEPIVNAPRDLTDPETSYFINAFERQNQINALQASSLFNIHIKQEQEVASSHNNTNREEIDRLNELFIDFTKVLPGNTRLKTLELENISVNGEKLQALLQALNATKIESLNLSSNNINAKEDVAALVTLLSTNTTLVDVNLSENAFSAEDIQELINAMVSNPRSAQISLNLGKMEFSVLSRT